MCIVLWQNSHSQREIKVLSGDGLALWGSQIPLSEGSTASAPKLLEVEPRRALRPITVLPSGLPSALVSEDEAGAVVGGRRRLGPWSQPVWVQTPEPLIFSPSARAVVISISGPQFPLGERVGLPGRAFGGLCAPIHAKSLDGIWHVQRAQ